MKSKSAIVAALLLISSVAGAGDTAHVPVWDWVETVPDGDHCGIWYGGLMEVLSSDGVNLLIQYTIPGDTDGIPCESGVVFIASEFWFREAKEMFWIMEAQKKARRELESRLLKKAGKAPPQELERPKEEE